MVNGNYVLYGDRPSSESEIVDDHVHTRTVDRKNRRKANRTANELQRTLNLAQLDNETDSIKYEKKIKEPRLLRYVPTTDVEENFVSEKFETYDLKPTEERPRRYAFMKKPKNPADGSVNYAYSRSSSSCSSPNGNLPTISEHCEQYGTYRVRPVPSSITDEPISGYESKLDKYFTKPREVKPFTAKGSHPDSLYRVAADSGAGDGKMARVLRVLRWPAALLVVCIALAAFVYFLVPDNMETPSDTLKATFFEPVSGAHDRANQTKPGHEPVQQHHNEKTENTRGTKTSEIDFYDNENDRNYDLTSIIGSISETNPQRKPPIPPVFPSHITPEVQYGNEKADTDKLRTPKLLDETNNLAADSTLKPHITQKPEKPLAIYFKEDSEAIPSTTSSATFTTTTESISRAETVNDFTNYNEKQTTRRVEDSPVKTHPSAYKEFVAPVFIERAPLQKNIQDRLKQIDREPAVSTDVEEIYSVRPVNPMFTSGHSKLFGISIEDAEKIKSTTQSSLYNTRVSPTLPTWRDGDDTTTKKYPTNTYTEVPQCGSTRLALCRGVLPYDLAGSPAIIGGVEATSLMSQLEYLVATNCSDRMRHFACALLEPECSPPPYPPKMPCYNLCKAIVDSCDGLIPRELTPAFNCRQYARSNCVSAKAPCFHREFTCGDGSCVPRDWICDGSKDCLNGEDEGTCIQCEKNEFRCRTGSCILKRWLCDGYADCADGEDEDNEGCGIRDEHVPGDGRGELGEESAGSAPAPAIRRPNRIQGGHHRTADILATGENDSSKELLVTSDSNNGLKRNFTRRPSPSRLSPYTRSAPIAKADKDITTPTPRTTETKQLQKTTTPSPILEHESIEDVNIGDLGFFDEFDKEGKDMKSEQKGGATKRPWLGVAPPVPNRPRPRVPPPPSSSSRLNKETSKFEKVIDGASLLREAAKQSALEDKAVSTEKNGTTVDTNEEYGGRGGSISAHASPCPSGELRCVDGRCITLAQLCDGTIDCSDHADEDNCYT